MRKSYCCHAFPPSRVQTTATCPLPHLLLTPIIRSQTQRLLLVYIFRYNHRINANFLSGLFADFYTTRSQSFGSRNVKLTNKPPRQHHIHFSLFGSIGNLYRSNFVAILAVWDGTSLSDINIVPSESSCRQLRIVG